MRFRIGFVACSNKADYKDSSLPVETRVQDLLGRMTVEEKAAQLDMLSAKRNCHRRKILYPMNS